jgi:diaminohydroxyphosphoribosylaminopyrimidine deaminase/5-amino-6-(5-phosphoribosylamino)uracil reductase
VTLKLAETADGYAAGDVHDGRLMITGVAANNRVQMMRASHDAIMVGAGTVRMDDPLLTVRMPGLDGRKPLRVVLDGHLSISINSRLVATCTSHPLVVFCGETVDADKVAALRDEGVEIAHTATDQDGQVILAAVLQALGGRGITRVFSEGGPSVGSALIDEGLADEVVLFTSQKPINRHGVPALSETARARLAETKVFDLAEDGVAGADRMRIWRRRL